MGGGPALKCLPDLGRGGCGVEGKVLCCHARCSERATRHPASGEEEGGVVPAGVSSSQVSAAMACHPARFYHACPSHDVPCCPMPRTASAHSRPMLQQCNMRHHAQALQQRVRAAQRSTAPGSTAHRPSWLCACLEGANPTVQVAAEGSVAGGECGRWEVWQANGAGGKCGRTHVLM